MTLKAFCRLLWHTTTAVLTVLSVVVTLHRTLWGLLVCPRYPTTCSSPLEQLHPKCCVEFVVLGDGKGKGTISRIELKLSTYVDSFALDTVRGGVQRTAATIPFARVLSHDLRTYLRREPTSTNTIMRCFRLPPLDGPSEVFVAGEITPPSVIEQYLW